MKNSSRDTWYAEDREDEGVAFKHLLEQYVKEILSTVTPRHTNRTNRWASQGDKYQFL